MKKNILLILFLLLTTFSHDLNTYNNNQLRNTEATKKLSVSSKSSNSNNVYKKKSNNKDWKKNIKITKKDLKKEIKKRKKYHRSLLSTYNESFENTYLDKIAYNSKRLSDLRKLL